MASYPVHPYCALFPDMDDEQFTSLVTSIAADGQRDRGFVYRGRVVDGRHRQRACEQLGIKFQVVEWVPATKNPDAELLEFVLAKNLHRRQLTTSQRAMIIVQSAEFRASGRTDKENAPKISQQAAADIANVSRRQIQNAAVVVESGTKTLQQAVLQGEVTVSDAAKVARKPRSAQRKALNKVREGKAKTVQEADSKPNVPARFQAVWKWKEKFAAYERLHSPAIGELAVGFSTESGAPINTKLIVDLLGQIYRMLAPWEPKEVCECGGENKGCRDCQGRGWLRKG